MLFQKYWWLKLSSSSSSKNKFCEGLFSLSSEMFPLILHRRTLLWKVPKFHLITWCTNFVKMHSFVRVSGDTPKTLRKMWVSTKFPHQKNKWNYGILYSICSQWLSMLQYKRGGGGGGGGINISKYPNDSYLTRFSLGFDVFCVSAFHDWCANQLFGT